MTACWVRRGAGLVGLGKAWHETFASPAEADAWWADLVASLDPATHPGLSATPSPTSDPSSGATRGPDPDLRRDPRPTPGPRPGPVAFVSFPFDPGHTTSRCHVVVPQTVVGRGHGAGWVTSWGDPPVGLVTASVSTHAGAGHPAGSAVATTGPQPLRRREDLSPLVDRAIAIDSARGRANTATFDPGALDRTGAPTGAVTFGPGALDHTAWLAAVERALALIERGDLAKVVLARDELARCDRPLDVAGLLDRLHRDHPESWTFAVAGLVGATPELLVRRDHGRVSSRVLAGTIRAATDRPGAGDNLGDSNPQPLAPVLTTPRDGGPKNALTGDPDAQAHALATSAKDLAEHDFAVASVVDALAPHCTNLTVSETPFVLRLPNVFHLASDIAGTTRSGASVLQLAAAVHPSAAVCGTPTAAARQAIRGLEGFDRGRYAGPVGWVGADGDGEIGLALRCGQVLDATSLRLFAGCGIVRGSDPAAEWAEAAAKLVPMERALAEATPGAA